MHRPEASSLYPPPGLHTGVARRVSIGRRDITPALRDRHHRCSRRGSCSRPACGCGPNPPMPLVRPSLRASSARQQGQAGAEQHPHTTQHNAPLASRDASAGACAPALPLPSCAAPCTPPADPAPEHKAGARRQVLWALQEAEAHARAVSRPAARRQAEMSGGRRRLRVGTAARAPHRRRSRSMATTRADWRTISQWMTACSGGG